MSSLRRYIGYEKQYAPTRQRSFNSQLQQCQCNYIYSDLTTEPRRGDGGGGGNEREERGEV